MTARPRHETFLCILRTIRAVMRIFVKHSVKLSHVQGKHDGSREKTKLLRPNGARFGKQTGFVKDKELTPKAPRIKI